MSWFAVERAITLDKQRTLLASATLGALFLFVWPLLFAPVLGSLPKSIVGVAYIASVMAGVVLIIFAVSSRLKAEGRARGPDRPVVGLAGKSWGIVFPNVTLPPAIFLGFSMSLYGLTVGQYIVPLAFVLCACVAVSYAFISPAVAKRKQQIEIRSRTESQEYVELSRNADRDSRCMIEATDLIARTFRVPPGALRMSDRFGVEIGTTSVFDDSLDRLGGSLLNRMRTFRRSLELDSVRTVGDYVREWVACGRRPDASE